MRWYTAGVAVLTGAAVATAIEMRTVADRAQQAQAHAAELRAYVASVDRHAVETQAATAKLTRQYDEALATATRTQRRMLADLRKARRAARRAQTVNVAPVVYSTQFSAVAGVAPAAAAAPTSGSS